MDLDMDHSSFLPSFILDIFGTLLCTNLLIYWVLKERKCCTLHSFVLQWCDVFKSWCWNIPVFVCLFLSCFAWWMTEQDKEVLANIWFMHVNLQAYLHFTIHIAAKWHEMNQKLNQLGYTWAYIISLYCTCTCVFYDLWSCSGNHSLCVSLGCDVSHHDYLNHSGFFSCASPSLSLLGGKGGGEVVRKYHYNQ